MATEFVSKEQASMEFMALTGKERKEAGMKQAAKNHKEDLIAAQYLAYVIAEQGASITIEDVRILSH